MTSLAPAAATATAAPMPKIIGKAVYLELVNNPDAPEKAIGFWYKNAVRQIILFPEHIDEVGNVKPAALWERVVSPHSPRSQWNHTIISRYVKKPTAEELAGEGYHISFPTYTSDEYKALTDKEKFDAGIFTLTQALKGNLLDTYSKENPEGEREWGVSQNWVLRDSKPIVVEITDEDASDTRSYKTPQAVIRRIQKARVAVGFPEKLV
jgi:hypothetical protein